MFSVWSVPTVQVLVYCSDIIVDNRPGAGAVRHGAGIKFISIVLMHFLALWREVSRGFNPTSLN